MTLVKRMAVAASGLVLALAAAEITVRAVPSSRPASEVDIYAPHHHSCYRVAPHAPTLNLRGPHNALGLRGPEITPRPEPGWARIVCVGGSTTYGTRNEEPQCWPRQLEVYLRATRPKTEVVNAGIPAFNSAENLQFLREVVLPLEPHLVVLYLGANDVIPRWVPQFRSDYAHLRRTWERPSRWGEASASALVRRLGRAISPAPAIGSLRQLTSNPYPEVESAERQAFSNTRATAFERNARSMVDAIQGAGIRVLLLTQTYEPNLLPRDMGYRGEFYRRGLEEHATALREIAAATGGPFYDIQKEFDREGAFDDFVHHSDLGARRMALKVGRCILERGLLPP